MSNVYFIRHGQAGTREVYDSLSELGRTQARLLGRYFVSQGLEFAAAYAGRLLRRQQTAASRPSSKTPPTPFYNSAAKNFCC